MLRGVLALLACLVAVPAGATTWYVNVTGSDANSCAQAQGVATPKRTINAALVCVGGGAGAGANDVVEVAAGTYTEVLDNNVSTVWPSGTSWAAPFTLRAACPVTNQACSGSVTRIAGSGEMNVRIFGNQSWFIYIDGFRFDGAGVTYQMFMGSGTTGPDDVRITNNEFINNDWIDHVSLFVTSQSNRVDITGNYFHQEAGVSCVAETCGYPIYYQGSDGTIAGNIM